MRKMLFGLMTLMLLFGCERDKEFYKKPDWLTGSVYEILQKEEKFSIYLEAVDRLGLKEDFDGKALMTCFIPNNDAFKAYLSEKGYDSVEDMPEKELDATIRYTMCVRSFNKEELETYHFSSSPQMKGKYYRVESYYTKDAYEETMTNSEDQKKVWLYNMPKTVSYFTQTYFDAIELDDPKKSVDFLLGDGAWDGDLVLGNGAKVLTYEIPANNGYVYEVDKLTDPLMNIEDVLTSNSEFSLFKEIYDYFSDYQYMSKFNKYAGAFGVDSLYRKNYDVFNTFWEADMATALQYVGVAKLHWYSGSMFVPQDQVLRSYLDEKFGPGSADNPAQLPLLTLKYLVEQHAIAKQHAWLEQIQDGSVQTNWGDNFEFNESDVFYQYIGSNGVIYGLNKVLSPSFFNSVLGPVLFNPNESIFSWIVEKTQSTNLVNNRSIGLGLIVADNEAFTDKGYRVSNEGYPIGDEKIQYNDNGSWKDYPYQDLVRLMDLHIAVIDDNIDFSQEGIVKNLGSFSLFKYKNNKLYVNESDLNETDKLYAEILEIDETPINGITYHVTNPLTPAKNKLGGLLSGYDQFSEFGNLLEKCELLDGGKLKSSLVGVDNFIVLAPSNSAIAQGIANGLIPALPQDSDEDEVKEDKIDELQVWCKQYFISMQENSQTHYLIPGDPKSKEFETMQFDPQNSTVTKKAYVKVDCTPNAESLTVKSHKTGKELETNADEPVMIASNGLLYSIDELF
ncbi:hypothetical protein EYV94_03500 [Puteibacter caeruleilacunae]|nr:hypothetical protein EYV94_03500 [Puteibacter caeruleilacunae]